jgi:predicted nucleic acid-binding protein
LLGSELIVCDTSFVGATLPAARYAERTADWSSETRARLDEAVLAVSVISVAEVRAGLLRRRLGARRVERIEQHLATFARLPLDEETLEAWARLRAASLDGGWNVGENDLWIAATARTREVAVAACDRDFARIDDSALEVIYLPATSSSPPAS